MQRTPRSSLEALRLHDRIVENLGEVAVAIDSTTRTGDLCGNDDDHLAAARAYSRAAQLGRDAIDDTLGDLDAMRAWLRDVDREPSAVGA